MKYRIQVGLPQLVGSHHLVERFFGVIGNGLEGLWLVPEVHFKPVKCYHRLLRGNFINIHQFRLPVDAHENNIFETFKSIIELRQDIDILELDFRLTRLKPISLARYFKMKFKHIYV